MHDVSVQVRLNSKAGHKKLSAEGAGDFDDQSDS